MGMGWTQRPVFPVRLGQPPPLPAVQLGCNPSLGSVGFSQGQDPSGSGMQSGA